MTPVSSCDTVSPPLPCPVSNSIPVSKPVSWTGAKHGSGVWRVLSLCQPPHSMAETPITSSRYGLRQGSYFSIFIKAV